MKSVLTMFVCCFLIGGILMHYYNLGICINNYYNFNMFLTLDICGGSGSKGESIYGDTFEGDQ